MGSLLCDENGATSVLIIFMMLVLVILGAYSISSAHVNYTFSARALEWKQAYYECDAMAEEFLTDTDAALAGAEKETAEAVIQSAAGAAPGYTEQSVNDLYRQNVLKEFSVLADKYDIQIDGDGLAVSSVISSEGESQINDRIAAAPFRYSIDAVNGTVMCLLNENDKRYTILEWRQVQKINEDNEATTELWDGIVR